MKFFGCGPQAIKYYARFDASQFALWINVNDARHVFRKIEDDRNVAALSCEGCSAAPTENWRAIFSRGRDRGNNIVSIARKHDANRDLAIIRGIRRIESAAAIIEANFAMHAPLERTCKLNAVHVG